MGWGLDWSYIGSLVKDAVESGGHSGGGSSHSFHPMSDLSRLEERKEPDVFGYLKETDTILGQALQLKDDIRDEAKELATDGFYHIVIKGEKDYKTSFDYRDEADNVVSDAMIEYVERCSKFNQYIESFNKFVNCLFERKKALLEKIDQKLWYYGVTRRAFAISEVPHYKYTPSTKIQICHLFGLDIDGAKESGKEYLNEAKDYQVLMKGKCAELNRIEAVLETIKVWLQEEESLLDILEQSLYTYERDKLNKIRDCLNTMLIQYVITENGEYNKLYKEALEVLKSLEE